MPPEKKQYVKRECCWCGRSTLKCKKLYNKDTLGHRKSVAYQTIPVELWRRPKDPNSQYEVIRVYHKSTICVLCTIQ